MSTTEQAITWTAAKAGEVTVTEFVHNGMAVAYAELPDGDWFVMRYDLTDKNATLLTAREPNAAAALAHAETLARGLLDLEEL